MYCVYWSQCSREIKKTEFRIQKLCFIFSKLRQKEWHSTVHSAKCSPDENHALK